MDIPFDNEVLKEFLLASSKNARYNLLTQIKGINKDVKTVLFQLGSRCTVNLERLTLSKKNNTYHKVKRNKHCDTKRKQFSIMKTNLSITKNSAKHKKSDKVNHSPSRVHKKNSDSEVRKLNIVKAFSPSSCHTRTRPAIENTEKTPCVSPRSKRNATPTSRKEDKNKTPKRLQNNLDKSAVTKSQLKSRNLLKEAEKEEHKSKSVKTSNISTKKDKPKTDIIEPESLNLKRPNSTKNTKENNVNKSSNNHSSDNNSPQQERQSIIIKTTCSSISPKVKVEEDKLETNRELATPRKLKVHKVRDGATEKTKSATKKHLVRRNSSNTLKGNEGEPCPNDILPRRGSHSERIRLKCFQLFELEDENDIEESDTSEEKKRLPQESLLPDISSHGEVNNCNPILSKIVASPAKPISIAENTNVLNVEPLEPEIVTLMEEMLESVEIFLNSNCLNSKSVPSEVSTSTMVIPVSDSGSSQEEGSKLLKSSIKTTCKKMKKRRHSSFIASENVSSNVKNETFFVEYNFTVTKNKCSSVTKSDSSEVEKVSENIPMTSIRQDSVIVSANVSSNSIEAEEQLVSTNPQIRQTSVIESRNEQYKNKENSCLASIVLPIIHSCVPQKTIISTLEHTNSKSKPKSPIHNPPKESTNKITNDLLKSPRETIIRETGLPAKTTKTASTSSTTEKVCKPKLNNNSDTPNVQDIILKNLVQMDKINENSPNIEEETKQKSQYTYYKPLHSILKNNTSAQENESTQNGECASSSFFKTIKNRRKTINESNTSAQRTDNKWEGNISQANYISYGQILENRKEIFSVKKPIDFVTPLMVAHTGWSTPQFIDLPVQKYSNAQRRRDLNSSKNDASVSDKKQAEKTISVNEHKKPVAEVSSNSETTCTSSIIPFTHNSHLQSKTNTIPNRRDSTIETEPTRTNNNRVNEENWSKQIVKHTNSAILDHNTKTAESAGKSIEKTETVNHHSRMSGNKIDTNNFSKSLISKRASSTLVEHKSKLEESSKKMSDDKIDTNNCSKSLITKRSSSTVGEHKSILEDTTKNDSIDTNNCFNSIISKRRSSTLLEDKSKIEESSKKMGETKIGTNNCSKTLTSKRRNSTLVKNKSKIEGSSKKMCLISNAINIEKTSDKQVINPKINNAVHGISKNMTSNINNIVEKHVEFSKCMPLLDDSPEQASKKSIPSKIPVSQVMHKRSTDDKSTKKRNADKLDQTSRAKRICATDAPNLKVKINLNQINFSGVFPKGDTTSTDVISVKDAPTGKANTKITENGKSIQVTTNNSLQINNAIINEIANKIDIPVHNKNSFELSENIEPKNTEQNGSKNPIKLQGKSTNGCRMSVDSAIDLDYLESNEDIHKESQLKNQTVVELNVNINTSETFTETNIIPPSTSRSAFNLLNSPYVSNLLRQRFLNSSTEPVALTLLTIEKAAKQIVDVFMALMNYCNKLKLVEAKINTSPQQYAAIAPELKHIIDFLLTSALVFYKQTKAIQIINFDMNQFCTVLHITVKKRMAPANVLTIHTFRKEMIQVIKIVTACLTQAENKTNLYSLLRENIDKLSDSQENTDNLSNGDSNTAIDLTTYSAHHILEQSPKATSTKEDVVISPPPINSLDLLNIDQSKSYLLPQNLQERPLVINIPTVVQRISYNPDTLIKENNNNKKKQESNKLCKDTTELNKQIRKPCQRPQQPLLNCRTSSKSNKITATTPHHIDDALDAHLQNLSTRNKAMIQNNTAITNAAILPPALILVQTTDSKPSVKQNRSNQNKEQPSEPSKLKSTKVTRNRMPKHPLQNIVEHGNTLPDNLMNNAVPMTSNLLQKNAMRQHYTPIPQVNNLGPAPLLDRPTHNNIPSYHQINMPHCGTAVLNTEKVNNTGLASSQNLNKPTLNNYSQQYVPVLNNVQCPSVNDFHTAATNIQNSNNLNMRYPYPAYPSQSVYPSNSGSKPPAYNITINSENIRFNQDSERLMRSQEHRISDDPLQTRQEMSRYLNEQLKISTGKQQEIERSLAHRNHMIFLENVYYNQNRAQLHAQQYDTQNVQLTPHQWFLQLQNQHCLQKQQELHLQNQQQLHLQQQYKQQQQLQQYLQQEQQQQPQQQQQQQQQWYQQQKHCGPPNIVISASVTNAPIPTNSMASSSLSANHNSVLNYQQTIGTNLQPVNHKDIQHFNSVSIQTASNFRHYNTTTTNNNHPTPRVPSAINVSQDIQNIPNSNSESKNEGQPGSNKPPINNLNTPTIMAEQHYISSSNLQQSTNHTRVQDNSIDQILSVSPANNITINQNIYHSSHNTLIQVTSEQNQAILTTNKCNIQQGNQQTHVINTQENHQTSTHHQNSVEIARSNNRSLMKILESVILQRPQGNDQITNIQNNEVNIVPDNTVQENQSNLISVPEKNWSPCHNIDQILNKAILEHGLNNQLPDSNPMLSKPVQEKSNHNIDQILNNDQTDSVIIISDDAVQPTDTSTASNSIGTISNSIQTTSNSRAASVNTVIHPIPINVLQSGANSSENHPPITNVFQSTSNSGETTISNSTPLEIAGNPNEYIDVDMLRNIVRFANVGSKNQLLQENPKILPRNESADSGYTSPGDHNTQPHNELDRCEGCSGPGNFLCSGCQSVHYCSHECQSKLRIRSRKLS